MNETKITVNLYQITDYRFEVLFGEGMPALISDEPTPLGTNLGPSPVQLLCAAVGNCLSDSLLFAFRKYKHAPEPIHCEVQATVGRNEAKRVRVLKIEANLRLGLSLEKLEKLEHIESVLSQFEEFCTVTQSVGQGIPIQTNVIDSNGITLYNRANVLG
jgi:uncharacterized OsmC-like protein